MEKLFQEGGGCGGPETFIHGIGPETTLSEVSCNDPGGGFGGLTARSIQSKLETLIGVTLAWSVGHAEATSRTFGCTIGSSGGW